jgi:hypothetical protein
MCIFCQRAGGSCYGGLGDMNFGAMVEAGLEEKPWGSSMQAVANRLTDSQKKFNLQPSVLSVTQKREVEACQVCSPFSLIEKWTSQFDEKLHPQ